MSAAFEPYREAELGLEDLVAVVREFLIQSPGMRLDARVAELPDARTLRYYQTIGLIHKPSRYEGRRAVYGFRHLLQALGVKLLQGQGFSLAQIQRALQDIDDAALERVVVDALGERQSVPGAPPPILPRVGLPEREIGKQFIAVEVGEGVSVIMDPVHVTQPEVLIAAISELLNAIAEET